MLVNYQSCWSVFWFAGGCLDQENGVAMLKPRKQLKLRLTGSVPRGHATTLKTLGYTQVRSPWVMGSCSSAWMLVEATQE